MDHNIKNKDLNIRRTFLCGQCFRWTELDDGSFEGIAYGRYLHISQCNDIITLHDVNKEDIPLWESYLDMDTDYSSMVKKLSADKTLAAACQCSQGIRILKQEPFETLISFIISQNNNIPRIKGIIDRLCESFGTRINGGYAFPELHQLEGVAVDDLAPLRAGFRAKYICDAVRKVSSGEVNFTEIDALPLAEAREKLKLICGVGDKVADCVLLFAFKKYDSFPRDVWVKRMMAQFYPDGLPECTAGIEGIAQQFLFDYVRNNNGLEIK